MKAAALLPLAVSLLTAAVACTQTKVVEEQGEPAPKGDQPGASNALADLPADWNTKAGVYLDTRVQAWLDNTPDIANVKCAMTCHTGFPAVFARSSFGKAVTINATDSLRSAFEERVSEGDKAIPFYGETGDSKTKESAATESILNATWLAFDDLGKDGTGALSATTKTALDRMWSLQNADGSWSWLEFNLEPWETRNDFGVGMAALLAGSIPDGSSSAQAAGVTKIKSYVAKNLSGMALHDQVVVLWASGSLKGLIDPAKADSIASALIAKQRDDGGFSLRSWGKGDLADANAASDGYATALATLGICKGTDGGAAKPEVQSALTWLATHQKSDGSWPGASTNSNGTKQKGYMTDAATSYAVLAITQCGLTK